MSLLIVIRLKGQSGRKPDEEKTLELLRLHKKFHAVLIKDSHSYKGMLQVLNNVVTWGEIDEATLAKLIEKRGYVTGGKRITLDYLKNIGYESFEDLARDLITGKKKIDEIPGLKPVFRLRPPKGGFKGTIKKHFREGGETGYRGEAINDLVLKMI
ncbi:MAG: 50S ribosomal protein L30 [Thermoprotei archaeon]|nr:50S ribosomal protein L30 [Thermoproteales archaeon]RLE76715.1 MAG: 50S ribosomal protein L30 [Thermoprotei archaeon]RLE76789.1 MAG: 50S ribosomal protein L30 [Thermoprotei archaeon]RLE85005.1 MAG: 50S ribosomal protein L30 [Thermoprotei archaeon]